MEGNGKIMIQKQSGCILIRPKTSALLPTVYALMNEQFSQDAEMLVTRMEEQGFPIALVIAPPKNWDDDYTPWEADPSAGRSRPFGGKADQFLNELVHDKKKRLEVLYDLDPSPERTAVVGYSLGGLASLYAGYRYEEFGKIGSVSGSLWYAGWIDYMKTHQIKASHPKIYLSLGSKEENSKDPMLMQSGNAVRSAREILSSQIGKSGKCVLEWNAGGHFSKIPNRIEKCLNWLVKG